MDAFTQYFPDYGESQDGYNPPREYFWNVFFTLEPVFVEAKVKLHIKYQRRNQQAGDKSAIPIRQDIYDLIKQKTMIPSKV